MSDARKPDLGRENFAVVGPGLGQQGYYYYVHALARALRVAQQHEIVDRNGRSHCWRDELIDALLARQLPNGQWVNSEDRWLEGNPALATAYALLALEEALKPAGVPTSPPEEPLHSP